MFQNGNGYSNLFLRGHTFRETYRRLGEIRSLVPPSVHLMAVTATATKTTRSEVYRMLGMYQPALVYVPPIKKNIIYCVKPKTEIEDLVNELSRNVIELHETFPKHIIFCR